MARTLWRQWQCRELTIYIILFKTTNNCSLLFLLNDNSLVVDSPERVLFSLLSMLSLLLIPIYTVNDFTEDNHSVLVVYFNQYGFLCGTQGVSE